MAFLQVPNNSKVKPLFLISLALENEGGPSLFFA
jgi:hypothetical protein